ncbi:MAG: DoxX family protein, partial [Alphaproteobacteria bacterium]|nr:DoxX family protein [Alphaproteobacteria bacterium]MBM3624918.1 DoxX family protein [Alphaproteobacteria bacterium]
MNIITTIARWMDAIPYSLIALFLRIVAAHPFFVSGQTKIEGPTVGGELFGLDLSFQIPTAVRDSTFALFADEYKVPLISPTVAAYVASGVEFVLPLLLVLGLLTRLSAFCLLMMTMVIQIFVYPDAWWTVHAYWAAILVVLIARGPGVISLDHLLFRRRSA